MRSATLSFLAAAVLNVGHFVWAELTDTPTVENYVRRFSATAVVLGNYVYIDGGEISQLENGVLNKGRATNQVNSTLSIDLTTSWNTTDVTFQTTPRTPGGSKANVVLWPNPSKNAFYSWGGKWIYGKNQEKASLWKFTPDGKGTGTWEVEPPSNPSTFNGLVPAEYIAFTTVNNTGYAIGGQASGWTEFQRGHNQAIPGTLTYNFDTREWTNSSTVRDGFSPFNSISQASAHYVPTFGVVFVLGGFLRDPGAESNDTTNPTLNFANLTFFDPVKKKTYHQFATGDIPPSPRAEFCTAGWETPEKDGYEIFLFGGDNKVAAGKPKYRDAYILSLPGFVWTKLPEPPAGARAYHSCVAVGGRQVLSIGGTREGSGDKDDAPQGLLLFDMTGMEMGMAKTRRRLLRQTTQLQSQGASQAAL